MFNWLREKVKAAVLAGVNDALAEVQRPGAVEEVELLLEHEPQPETNNRRKVVNRA